MYERTTTVFQPIQVFGNSRPYTEFTPSGASQCSHVITRDVARLSLLFDLAIYVRPAAVFSSLSHPQMFAHLWGWKVDP